MTPGSKTVDLPSPALQARASAAYAAQSRSALEEKWILDHLPLVRHVVGKILGQVGRNADADDLISAGTLGLVKAARAFDPSKEVEFKTYAYIRIRGAVLDELRGRSFVPAGIHARVRTIEGAYQRLSTELGSPPDDEQLAAAAGLSPEELYRTLEEARKQNFLSLHGLNEDAPALERLVPVTGEPGPEASVERAELIEALTAAVAALPKRDRTILILYYQRDLTMKEIAGVLEITESRVSQLHAAALFKLSVKLKKRMEP